MDFSSITTVFSMVKGAQELASAAMGVKGFNDSAVTISEINQKLLAAQQGLLAHNTMLLQLQSDYFQATEELRKLKEAATEKARYDLVDLGGGVFVYCTNLAPMPGDAAKPGHPDVAHYLCQPCFDAGTKVVLQHNGDYWRCNGCKTAYQANPRSSQSVIDAINSRESYFP